MSPQGVEFTWVHGPLTSCTSFYRTAVRSLRKWKLISARFQRLFFHITGSKTDPKARKRQERTAERAQCVHRPLVVGGWIDRPRASLKVPLEGHKFSRFFGR